MPRPPNYDQNYINAQHEAAAYNGGGGAGAGQQPIMEDQQEVGEEGYGTFALAHHSNSALPRARFASEGQHKRLGEACFVVGVEEDDFVEGGVLTWVADPTAPLFPSLSHTPASSTPTSTLTWIAWFCSLPGHEYFCEVSEDFIEDDFNLTGLASLVPFWKEAMEMVLDVEPEDSLKIPDVTIVESSAELLYGLVHQRYILTRPGLQAMVEKYEAGHFGTCPRVYCHSTHVAPCGRTDLPGLDTVKLYCPNCNDIYTPPSSRFQGVDGAFFGTTFPHLLFQTFRELAPAPYCPPPQPVNTSARSPSGTYNAPTFVNPNPNGGQKAPAGRIYISKIYGFRVSERARSGPRMQWLRMRPETAEELDRVDHKGRWLDNEEFDEESEHDDRGRHTSSLFEGADDEEEDDDEEEEEDEPAQPSQQPPPHTSGRPGGRQRPGAPRIGSTAATMDASGSDSDSDSDTSIVAVPRIPPRYQKYFRYRKPAPSPPPARVAETDTDSGLVSSASCSSSALETPREELPQPVVAPYKGKTVLRTVVPELDSGLEVPHLLRQISF